MNNDNNHNNLLVINRLKNFCFKVREIVINFPKKELLIKDKIISDSLDIIEEVYYINTLRRNNVNKSDKARLISKLNMLDFYIYYIYKNNIINEKTFNNLSKEITEITKILYKWVYNENNAWWSIRCLF